MIALRKTFVATMVFEAISERSIFAGFTLKIVPAVLSVRGPSASTLQAFPSMVMIEIETPF